MLLNVLEIAGLILAYGFIATVVTKIGWWITEDDGSPVSVVVGAVWPVAVPFVVFLFAAVSGIMGICMGSNWLIDKLVSSVTAMYEEWRA